MGNLFSPTHLLIILLLILILFGRGKISDFMGDFAKGIKSFKKGLSDEDEPQNRLHEPQRQNRPHEHGPGEERRQKAAEPDLRRDS